MGRTAEYLSKLDEYQRILKCKLTKNRYEHLRAVQECAGELAMIHGLDREKAELAGLLHDYARELSDDELLRIGRAKGMITCEVEELAPVLLHGPVGAILVQEELSVSDPKVLEAIEQHTLAAPAMGRLAQLIYIADLIAEGRDFSEIGRLRKVAEKDLTQALLESIASAISYCLEREQLIHPRTIEAWNFYCVYKREEEN